ncbi:MAG: hypothetical protein HY716_15030 [Planctomycetes bacterium]|nr:hypothetical protein [Planctomycetota bacterium]
MQPLMLLVVLLLVQDPEWDAALRAERERVASKKPLTPEQTASYRQVAAPAANVRTSYTLGLVPLDLTDAPVDRPDAARALAGALEEYYRVQSGGAFELKAELLERRKLDVSRAVLAETAAGSPEERGALERLFRSMKTDGIDGFVLLVGGTIGERGTALWPHASSLEIEGRKLEYVLLPEKGDARRLGIAAHEFGHLLKLEDKYRDREARIGRWCLMGTGYLGVSDDDPRPAPLCAVCTQALKWFTPLDLDPAEEAKIALPPVEVAPGAAVRIAIAPGKEALILEARGSALIVWHTGGGAPIELMATLPAPEGDRLTPWSDPSFRAQTMGGRDVWITDVRAQDGKLYFKVGPSAELTPLEELRRRRVGKPLGR